MVPGRSRSLNTCILSLLPSQRPLWQSFSYHCHLAPQNLNLHPWEVINGFHKERGFSRAVSQRLAVSQRQSSCHEHPAAHRETPSWDLMVVLRYLIRPPFEPLNIAALAHMTRKLAFLLTLVASTKRNSDVWAFKADVCFGQNYSYPDYWLIPWIRVSLKPVKIPALGPSMGEDLPDSFLCPVHSDIISNLSMNSDNNKFSLLFAFKYGHTGDVTKQTGDVTKQTGDVTKMTGDITKMTGDVTKMTGDITKMTGDVTKQTGDVTKMTGDITKMTGDITEQTVSGSVRHLIKQAYSEVQDEDTPHLRELRNGSDPANLGSS